MSKTKKYQLVYQVKAEELEQVVNIAWEIHSEMGMDPKTIALPDGRQLHWNAFLADKFAAEGHISEKEFIEMSLTKDKIVK